jgi:N-acetylneuraminic acid mutarotase/uncharacterized coiled-coil protein SlyX
MLKRAAAVILCLFMIATTFIAAVPAAGASAELPAWEIVGTLPEPMALGASVSDGKGNIYLLGGENSSGGWIITNSTYVFSTVTHTYTKLAPMPVGAYLSVSGMGTDGRIYVAGGYNRSSSEFLKALQIYDPVTDSWSLGSEMTFASFDGFGGFSDGKLFVIGGMDDYSSTHGHVQIYDPESDMWAVGTDQPTIKFEGATVIRGSSVYCIGGIDGAYSAVNTVDVYDAEYNTWSTMVSLPETMVGGKGILGPDGTMYVLGNNLNPGGWYFDWVTNTWKALPGFAETFWAVMGGVGIDGDLYVFGGLNKTGSKKPVIAFVEKLDVMDVTVDVSSPVVTGTPSLVKMSLSLPFSDPEYFYYQYHLLGPDGTAYPPVSGYTTGNGTFALIITIPAGAPVGQYELKFDQFQMQLGFWYASISLNGSSFSVQEPTIEDQIAELQQQLTDAQNQVADLQNQVDDLNGKLDQTNSALDTDSNKLKSAIDNKADSMLSYLTIVLLVVVIALMALMMVRKKP